MIVCAPLIITVGSGLYYIFCNQLPADLLDAAGKRRRGLVVNRPDDVAHLGGLDAKRRADLATPESHQLLGEIDGGLLLVSRSPLRQIFLRDAPFPGNLPADRFDADFDR